VGDSSLFAGVATDRPAVSSPEVILSALEAALTGAGAISAADIETAVTTWFDDPSGFATVGYLGGTASSAISISPEDQVDLGITALDPAIKDTLKSLSLVALVARGTVVPDPETGKELVNRAGAALLQNQSDRIALSGRLGYMQARIDQAQTRNEAENSALQLARNNLLAVDPYEAATRMEAAQNQLETLYSVTARLSRLKLVDFLR
ncbi:MAG: flagellin, partial [Pseudorhodobacter sp.]